MDDEALVVWHFVHFKVDINDHGRWSVGFNIRGFPYTVVVSKGIRFVELHIELFRTMKSALPSPINVFKVGGRLTHLFTRLVFVPFA